MARDRVLYSVAKKLIASGQATAEQIAANFDLEDDEAPSVAEQARASMANRERGGDLPPGYAKDALEPKTFMGGVKDQLVPSWDQAKTLARAGYEMTPGVGPLVAAYEVTHGQTPAAAQIAKGVGSAHLNEGKRAASEFGRSMEAGAAGDGTEMQKRFLGAAGHGAAALLPVVGPAAAEAGEDINRGDVAYGAGKAAGLLGSMVAPEVAAKGVHAVTPAYRVTRAASFSDNLKRIAAASPDAPTLTGILKDAGPKMAKGAVVAAIGHAIPIPGFKYLVEFLGGEKAAVAGWKALRDLPKTAAFKAASATTKTQFAKALTTGAIEDAVRIGGEIVAGADAALNVPDGPGMQWKSAGVVMPGGSAQAEETHPPAAAPQRADRTREDVERELMPPAEMARYRRLYGEDPRALMDENPTAFAFFDKQYGGNQFETGR